MDLSIAAYALSAWLCILVGILGTFLLRTLRQSKSLNTQIQEMTALTASLTEAKEYAENVVQNMDEMVFVVDGMGRIKNINNAVTQHLGYKMSDLKGKRFIEIVSKDEMRSPVEKLYAAEPKSELTSVLISQLGEPCPVLFSGAHLDSKQIGDIVLVARSLDLENKLAKESQKRLEAEEEIQAAKEQTAILLEIQEEILQSQERIVHTSKFSTLGEMASGIGHEISQPISVVASLLRLLKEELSKPEPQLSMLRTRLDRISQMITRIGHIVHALRLYARDGSSDPFETSDFTQIVDETFFLCESKLKMHGVRFIHTPLKQKMEIQCRPTQISQLLLNLINNAFDAVKQDEDPWVDLQIQEQEEAIEITVTDSGSGIPDAIREKIFNPFFTTKGPAEGTGMGLSICMAIVQAHQGQIYLDKESNHTRFIVKLPKKLEITFPVAA